MWYMHLCSCIFPCIKAIQHVHCIWLALSSITRVRVHLPSIWGCNKLFQDNLTIRIACILMSWSYLLASFYECGIKYTILKHPLFRRYAFCSLLKFTGFLFPDYLTFHCSSVSCTHQTTNLSTLDFATSD